MVLLVYTVYCLKQPTEQRFCSTEKFCKFHRKTPVLKSLFNKVAGLTPSLKNICQRLVLHHSLLLIRFTLYSALSSSSLLLLDVWFWFKFKRLQRIEIWYLIFIEASLSLLSFSFYKFFLSFKGFVSFFLVVAHKKDYFKLRVD